MASGNSLTEMDVKINNFITIDLLLGVRIEDLVLFVSLRETLEGKTKLGDTSFIYPKSSGSLKQEELKSLGSKNPLIGISGLLEKKINFKKNIADVFGLSYVPEVASKKIVLGPSQPISVTMELLNKAAFTDSKFNSLNSKMNKANIFLIRSILSNKNDRSQFNERFGYLHFKDYKNFIEKSRITTKIENRSYFRNFDLPRLSTVSFMDSFSKQTGNLMSVDGTICWNLDENLDLVSNIEYSSDRVVTKVNYGYFDDSLINRETCYPDKFKLEDKLVGYFENGIYKQLDSRILEEKKSLQMSFYTENVKKLEKGKLTSYLKLKYRKFFSYPKISIYVLVIRENIVTPFFDKTIGTNMGKTYVEGFFNTLDPVTMKPEENPFANQLKQELLNFIMTRYQRRNRLTIRNSKKSDEVREILINIEKDIQTGYPRLKYGKREFYVMKEDYVRIIQVLTGIDDSRDNTGEGNSLKVFLKDPNILYGTIEDEQFNLLKFISYFVLCEDNEYCGEIKDVASPLTSMDMLIKPGIDNSYKMYFNTVTRKFTTY